MEPRDHLIGLFIVSLCSALTVVGLNWLLDASWVFAFGLWAMSVAVMAMFFSPVGRAR